MRTKDLSFRNLILLSAFAAIFSIIAVVSARSDRDEIVVPKFDYSSEIIMSSDTSTTTAGATEILESGVIKETAEVTETPAETEEITEVTEGISDDISEPEEPLFTVTSYESPVTMYVSDTVNVREGAGTEYEKVGKLSWGSEILVTGETDNGWYEVSVDDNPAYIIGDYVVSELPGTPYLFVGDSRTVQLEMAVGSSDKAYIAKVGEGYDWFRTTAMAEIPSYAGNGTTMIINFGVNDLANVNNYVRLINNNIDDWTNAGITVCYAAVTPVGNCESVSNSQIEKFNSKLKSELDPRVKWIDGYSFLSQTGFSAPDGLHYSTDTYKNLYSYYMSVIQQI